MPGLYNGLFVAPETVRQARLASMAPPSLVSLPSSFTYKVFAVTGPVPNGVPPQILTLPFKLIMPSLGTISMLPGNMLVTVLPDMCMLPANKSLKYPWFQFWLAEPILYVFGTCGIKSEINSAPTCNVSVAVVSPNRIFPSAVIFPDACKLPTTSVSASNQILLLPAGSMWIGPRVDPIVPLVSDLVTVIKPSVEVFETRSTPTFAVPLTSKSYCGADVLTPIRPV